MEVLRAARSSSGAKTPNSVMMPPVMSSWGVTSKAGFQTWIPAGREGTSGEDLALRTPWLVSFVHSNSWGKRVLENLGVHTYQMAHKGTGTEATATAPAAHGLGLMDPILACSKEFKNFRICPRASALTQMWVCFAITFVLGVLRMRQSPS